MDFKKATDQLLDGISHDALAKALGASVASVRQARLPVTAKAYRRPPEGWETGILRLADGRARHFAHLAARLRGDAKRK
jgi:hypothetical protein